MQFYNYHRQAIEIYQAALLAVDPYRLVHTRIQRRVEQLLVPDDLILDLKLFEHVFIIGAGKGCAPMTRALEEILGDFLSGGQIIVKYGHTDRLEKIVQHQAGHPLPDANSLKATRQLLDYTTRFSPRDLVFVLIGGGGSALLESLPDGISLDDLIELNRILLQCAAAILEINCIRKHVSMVKGGQLARYISPARCIALILSDVVGDDLSVIASGPTVPDPSSYTAALHILQKHNILNEIPVSIRSHLERGVAAQIAETPKPGDKIFQSVHNILIGNNKLALTAAAQKARELGFNTSILSAEIQEPVEAAAERIARMITEMHVKVSPVPGPACVLLGGETLVSIKGKGQGGRNQHLALLVADLLQENKKPYLFLSCGTDGTDGPTDAAGALVTSQTLIQAGKLGLNAQKFLENFDAYNFFKPLELLIRTGPTRTNVMDVMIVMVP
jgi:glycerate 2-kinase